MWRHRAVFLVASLPVLLLLLLLLLLPPAASAAPLRPRRSPSSLLDLGALAGEFAALRGACACKWPPKDPKKGNDKCGPQPALCGYCQQAVFQVTQGGGAGSGCSTATDAGMEACEKVAKEVDGKKTKIEKFYAERLQDFGPGGGWSLEFCLTMKCCLNK
jgi:hypothetical protein